MGEGKAFYPDPRLEELFRKHGLVVCFHLLDSMMPM